MIICPNCQNQEANGAIFCSQCGASLTGQPTMTTHKINTAEAKKMVGETFPFDAPAPDAPDSWVSIHMVETGQIIPLSDRTEYTLGRVSDGQPVMPDVDLTQYNAYANGVSRLHAVLKKIDNHAVLMDLGSSNGTYVNGKRIGPKEEQEVQHGDLINLGKLRFQLLFGRKG